MTAFFKLILNLSSHLLCVPQMDFLTLNSFHISCHEWTSVVILT